MAGCKGNTKSKNKEIKNKTNKNVAQNSEDAEDLDFSVLRRSISTSVTGFAQARKIFDLATEEVKELLCNECNMIYECKVCRNLFRSLANFISHKRIYCVEKFSIHTNFVDPTSTNNELQKIKRFEENYQNFLKEGVSAQNCTTDEDDNRIPLTKDLTTIVEKFVKTKGIQDNTLNHQDVVLHQISQSSVAVYQTSQLACNEDNMRSQVTELDDILSKENAVLQSDGKFKVQNNNEETENVIQISDDEDWSFENLKCNQCDQQFATRKTLRCHAKTKHLASRVVYPCPDCLETYSTSWSVLRHLFKVHRKSAAQVRRLRETIQSKAFLMNNPPPSYEKRKGNAKTVTPLKITEEERIERENQEWFDNMEGDGELPRCGGCGRKFERRAAFNAHTNTCQSRSKALARRAEGKKIEIQIRKDYSPYKRAITKPQDKTTNETTSPAKPVQQKEGETCTENTLTEAIMSIVGVTAHEKPEVPEETEKQILNMDVINPIHILPLSHQAEKSNFNALKQRVMQDIVLEELTCKKCGNKFKEFNELYDHVASHYKWVRYACKLCKFKHYEYEKVSDHVKIVHKLKGDSEFYFSTIKAIDGTEAIDISELKDENGTEISPTSRRPSRCSSDSSKLSDDSSSSSTRMEVGSKKRKGKPSKTATKKKKDFTNDEGDGDSKDSESSPQKNPLQIENDSSNSMGFNDNSSDLDDSEDKSSKRLKTDNVSSGISRRPVRKRTIPKNNDYEYDLSNLLKIGHRETQTNTNIKPPKKKTQQDIVSNYNALNKECCGSLASMSRQSVGKNKAEMGTTNFTVYNSTKDQKISNIFVRPMLPKIIRGDKVSPLKEVTLDNEKEITNKNVKPMESRVAEVCNDDSDKQAPPGQIAESDALSNNSEENVGDEKKLKEMASTKKSTTSPQEKSKSNLNLVPIKLRKHSLDLIKNPLIKKNMTEFNKAGMKTKILVIKHINKNDSTASINTPLKIKRIKINDANTSLKKDKKIDPLLVVNVPETDNVVSSIVVCNSNTSNEGNKDEGKEIEKNHGIEIEGSKTTNEVSNQETCLTQNPLPEQDTAEVAVNN